VTARGPFYNLVNRFLAAGALVRASTRSMTEDHPARAVEIVSLPVSPVFHVWRGRQHRPLTPTYRMTSGGLQ
jgi:hypothetical protein